MKIERIEHYCIIYTEVIMLKRLIGKYGVTLGMATLMLLSVLGISNSVSASEVWSDEGSTSNIVTFTDTESWEWDDTLRVSASGNNEIIEKSSVLKFNMTIDQDEYNSLGENGYIKLEVDMFNADNDWDTVVKLGWPQYNASNFNKNSDGTYTTEVIMELDKDVDNFYSMLIRGVGTKFSGDVTVSDISISEPDNVTELIPQEPTVVADFETGIDGWAGDNGWDYSHGKSDSVEKTEKADADWDLESKSLKMTVDYSKDLTSGWSEAKITGNFEAVDISNYNLVSFTLKYPSDMETVRTKLFMKDTNDQEILNSEGSFRSKTVKDAGEGWKMATIRGEFKPSASTVSSLTIGIVGPYSDLKNVYIDNVTFGQLDSSEDYVEINREVQTTPDKADISKMPVSVKLVDGQATDAAKTLFAYLRSLSDSHQVLFGHQNSTFRSVRTDGETSDIKDITGTEAGLFGIDSLALAGVETSKATRQDALDASVAASKKAYNGGSIITLSCHMPNFTNSKIKKNDDGTYDFTKCDFSESKDLTPCADYILDGGEYNSVFNAYLDIIADYAKELAKDDIPVLFRPFHENSGGWFWWGTSTSSEAYKAMWRYTVNYLEGKGVHNFLYVYSPNGPIDSEEKYLSRYPGDEYVDVLGFDYYDDYADASVYTGENYFSALGESCKVVKSLADKKSKLAVIAETGIRITGAGKDSLMVAGNPTKDKDWYNKVINTASENGIPYFLLWANFDSSNFFVPYKYNDTLGHEMINDFIEAYNNDKSIFGNGTGFYITGDSGNTDAALSKAKDINLKGYSSEITGYMILPKNYATIKEAFEFKALVNNASKVNFVIKTSDDSEPVTIKGVKSDKSNVYTGTLAVEVLMKLDATSTGTVKVVAYDNENNEKEIGVAGFINFNKDPDVIPANVFDNFEYYYGSDGLIQNKYGSSNSAAGCSSSVTLNDENKVEGDYGLAFNYELSYKGSEVWTGGLGRTFDNTDYSEYNALSLWVKPDGYGQKMVVQLTDESGKEYEAYLTDFVKGTKAQYVTIPFTGFIVKGGNASIDPSGIACFKLWCNSVPDNYDNKDDNGNYKVSSVIYFDDIRAVKLSDEQLANAEKGLIITDKPIDAEEEKKEEEKKEEEKKKEEKKEEEKQADTIKKEDASKKEEVIVMPAPDKVGYVIDDVDSKCEFKVTISDSLNGEVELCKLTDNNVTKLIIPSSIIKNGVTYKVTSVSPKAFINNKKIKSVSLGDNVKVIGDNAFSGCTKLKKIDLGNGLTRIGYRAFYKNTSLTKIVIPCSVSKIGKQAFANCKKLKSITIATKLLTNKKVGVKAFRGIHKKAVIKVPKSKYKNYKKWLKKKGIGKKTSFSKC